MARRTWSAGQRRVAEAVSRRPLAAEVRRDQVVVLRDPVAAGEEAQKRLWGASVGVMVIEALIGLLGLGAVL